MNRSFIVAVLTVTTIIMMSTAGYAFLAPHNFACSDCHGKFPGNPPDAATARANAPVSSTNACVSCHATGGEASRMPVNPGDMSTYFGPVSGEPSTGSKSTHSYRAFTPYVPAANVVEATGLDTASNTVVITGSVVCIRCHNVKADTNSTPGVDKPLLRTSNLTDALCLNCHAPRNVITHATGSHPVAYRAYSTVYKSNTTAFRRVPLSPNANNPTANPGNYLSVPNKGKILCSTCHAPHYADSNSATLDNRSTANGFAADDPAKGLKGTLQNSKGQLLRTDPIGSSASAINVCSSCHKETRNLNHNAKGQNVQCNHCHGAHVDYTPGDTSAKNLYLVRRDFSNISISTGKIAAGKKAIYNTATSLRFMRNDGKGICQVCHTPTPGVAIHDQLDTRKEDCLGCHKHSDGFTAASCDACHGQPPVQGKAAPGYTALDEAFTPHATHADAAYYKYTCKNCHYDGTRADSHNTSPATFQSVFVDTAGSVGALAGYANVPANYNSVNRTCSVVYCHSNGAPRGGTISWKSATTPSWQYVKNVSGRNSILGQPSECITCHESGSTLNTNAHYKHVTTSGIKCYVCHYATVTGTPSIKDRTKHANGAKDVLFISRPENFMGGEFSASFITGNATCTNSCHTNGLGVPPATPANWTVPATGACGTCHPAVATTTLHPFHFTGTTGPKLGASPDCASCHNYSASTHANGVADLKPGNSCAPCHPAAAGTPIWAISAKVTCESCHTGTASVVASQFGTYTAPLKGLSGHKQYSTATVNKVKCTSCHNSSADHIGASPTEKRLTVTGNALCNSCHTSVKMQLVSTARANLPAHGGLVNSFTSYTAANRTAAVTTRAQDCAGCHDTHGTTNLMSIRTVINGKPISFKSLTSFVVTSKASNFYNGLCQACHTKTKYYRNYTSPATHNSSSNCLSCHKHNGLGVVFAFKPVGGGCSGCHGYPPVANMTGLGHYNNYTNAKIQDYAGGGGAHAVAGHIPKSAKESQGWTPNCSNCHYNTTHNTGGSPPKQNFVNVIVDPQFKFNNTSTIRYNANKCSNVSCHFKPSPNWITGL